MKHKFLSTISFLCMSFVAFATEEYMLVEMKTGEQYSFLLADRPVLTYENASLVINSDSKTSYAIEGIKEYRFVSNTSIDDISASALKIITIDDETIEVQNAKSSEKVVLMSVKGETEFCSKTDVEGKVIVKMPVNKGVYVLSVGNQSFKVIRK